MIVQKIIRVYPTNSDSQEFNDNVDKKLLEMNNNNYRCVSVKIEHNLSSKYALMLFEKLT